MTILGNMGVEFEFDPTNGIQAMVQEIEASILMELAEQASRAKNVRTFPSTNVKSLKIDPLN